MQLFFLDLDLPHAETPVPLKKRRVSRDAIRREELTNRDISKYFLLRLICDYAVILCALSFAVNNSYSTCWIKFAKNLLIFL